MSDEPLTERVWTAAWRRLQEAGVVAYAEAIRAQPSRFRAHVERFVAALKQARTSLDHIRQLGVPDARVGLLETRYAVLLAGLLSDRGDERFEGPPLLVVAGIGVGVVAIAWAIAAYQYAVHLREHTALLEKELVARVEASREGRTLPPSTVESPSTARNVGWLLLGGLAVGALGLAWRGRSS